MPKPEKYPTRAHVSGKEKRQKPTKHYVFIVHVTWSDGSRVPIYRQYSDFHQLHTDLVELVSVIPQSEAKVALPVFPAKKAFERAEISKAASVRKHAFDGYCKAVLDHPILAKSKIVCDFFLPKHTDINPVTEPEQTRRRSSLLTALAVLLPKKDEDKKGTLPKARSNTALNNLDETEEDPIYVSSPMILESYMVLADYMPQEKGEIMLKEDHMVQVVEKHTNGWWFVSSEYGDGWGPATHLESLDSDENDDEPDPVYSGSKYITTSLYTPDIDCKDEVCFPEGAMVDVLHKLMDGWWVIKYRGEVGYAPATYLAPFKNPNYRDSRYGQSRNKRPPKRKSTIKNAKGNHIAASVRDKSRDLEMYKKLSGEKSASQAAEVAQKLNSVQFKDTVSDENSPREGKMLVKTKLHRSVSNDSYEYIDEDEMDIEDVNAWVDEDTRKKKQEEQARKHDYENVPKIIISDASEIVSPPLAFRSQSQPAESSARRPQKAPAAPRGRAVSAPDMHAQQSDGHEASISSTQTHASSSRDSQSESSFNDNQSESSFNDKNQSQKANTSADTTCENPKEIDEMLTLIRKQRISRIYTNKNGEVVIKLTNADDMAAFGECDIGDRAESCPIDPESPVIPKQTNVPLYSKINKIKVKGTVQGVSPDKQQSESEAATCEDNNSKAKCEDTNSKAKTQGAKPRAKFTPRDDEFAIFV